MQPYQQASNAIVKQSNEPGEMLKKAGKGAAALAISAPIMGKVGALLNPFVPTDLAAKGLNKLDDRFGKFIEGVIKTGGTQQDAMDFIRGKVDDDAQEKSPKAKENRNIIEQYSPELNQFMSQEIQKGRSPIEAAALAQNNKNFASIIQKMSKDHKANWSAIAESIYGNAGVAQSAQKQQSGMQQPSQQGGNVDQALMAAFDKILKM